MRPPFLSVPMIVLREGSAGSTQIATSSAASPVCGTGDVWTVADASGLISADAGAASAPPLPQATSPAAAARSIPTAAPRRRRLPIPPLRVVESGQNQTGVVKLTYRGCGLHGSQLQSVGGSLPAAARRGGPRRHCRNWRSVPRRTCSRGCRDRDPGPSSWVRTQASPERAEARVEALVQRRAPGGATCSTAVAATSTSSGSTPDAGLDGHRSRWSTRATTRPPTSSGTDTNLYVASHVQSARARHRPENRQPVPLQLRAGVRHVLAGRWVPGADQQHEDGDARHR